MRYDYWFTVDRHGLSALAMTKNIIQRNAMQSTALHLSLQKEQKETSRVAICSQKFFSFSSYSYHKMIKTYQLYILSIFSFSLPLLAKPIDIFFGTGGRGAEGIYYATFNPENGKFTPSKLATEIGSPGFLTTHPNGKILYSLGRWDGSAGALGYYIGSKGEL